MLRVNLLRADHGDCIVLEYGDPQEIKRVLIDAGTNSTYENSIRPYTQEIASKDGKCTFELFVVTHVDSDHIGGAIPLLENLEDDNVDIKEIWFNGYKQISAQAPGVLGPAAGERLTRIIQDKQIPWNSSFSSRTVAVSETGPLPVITLPGLKITLLSPTLEQLRKLLPKWESEITKAGLVPGAGASAEEFRRKRRLLGLDVERLANSKFTQDKSEANGSSIAFLAEHDGKTVLLGADAFPSTLLESLSRPPLEGLCKIDAFKLPHHGSRNNISNQLVKLIPTSRYLISTNGHRSEHPDDEAISRILAHHCNAEKELYFNYRSKFNEQWESPALMKKYNYSVHFGTDSHGVSIDL